MKTLIFDLDGTLIDSRKDLSTAVNVGLKAIGKATKSEREIIPLVGDGLEILLKKAAGEVSPTQFESLRAAFSDHYKAHSVDFTRLYPGVLEGLRELHQRFNLGIVTNKPEDFARDIVSELKIARFVSLIIGGDSLKERKPNPAPLIKAIQELKGKVETTMMIGDGIQDVKAGKNAGIKTCLARYGYGFRSDILELKPDFIIDRFLDLKEIVR